MTTQIIDRAAPPELTTIDYEVNFGEFIGVGTNGNLWIEG